MGIRNLLMVLSLAISICIGLVLARGGNSTGANSFVAKELSIGLSMDSLKEARWQVDRDVIVARCKEQGIRVQVQAANSDDAS